MADLGERHQDEPIPIPNINAAVLRKVIEYCIHHKYDPPTNGDDSDNIEKIEEWDERFMRVNNDLLFDIISVYIR